MPPKGAVGAKPCDAVGCRCGKTFTNQAAQTRHRHDYAKLAHECVGCQARFKMEPEMVAHRVECDMASLCGICGAFIAKDKEDDHAPHCGAGACDRCHLMLASGLTAHMAKCGLPFSCKIGDCGKRFATLQEGCLHTAVCEKQPNAQKICPFPECDDKLPDGDALKIHVTNCPRALSWVCVSCKEKITVLPAHKCTTTTICPTCKKEFVTTEGHSCPCTTCGFPKAVGEEHECMNTCKKCKAPFPRGKKKHKCQRCPNCDELIMYEKEHTCVPNCPLCHKPAPLGERHVCGDSSEDESSDDERSGKKPRHELPGGMFGGLDVTPTGGGAPPSGISHIHVDPESLAMDGAIKQWSKICGTPTQPILPWQVLIYFKNGQKAGPGLSDSEIVEALDGAIKDLSEGQREELYKWVDAGEGAVRSPACYDISSRLGSAIVDSELAMANSLSPLEQLKRFGADTIQRLNLLQRFAKSGNSTSPVRQTATTPATSLLTKARTKASATCARSRVTRRSSASCTCQRRRRRRETMPRRKPLRRRRISLWRGSR